MSLPFTDLVRRAGCWSVGLIIVSAFFAIGAFVALLNGDMLSLLQALLLTLLTAAGGIWLGRRARKSEGGTINE